MLGFRLLTLTSLAALTLALHLLSACGTQGSHPGSLLSTGQTNPGGGSGQVVGGAGLGDAGQMAISGSGAAGKPSGGESGEGESEFGGPARPLAVYPNALEADDGCGGGVTSASLVIRNQGGAALTITSASANSGYVIATQLPFSIEPDASATLSVTPPAPAASAKLGDTINGVLSFTTNEPGLPVHSVALTTQLFGGQLEFTDQNGTPLGSTLTLTYLEASDCPDTLKYRVHNTGNLAFTLLGPTFPANLAGTSTGTSGATIAPDGYFELMVGGDSSPGDVCGASGQLRFSTTGSFCGAVPTLNVVWPASTGPSCSCAAD